MEPRADLKQRSNASVDSLTPVRLTLRAAYSAVSRAASQAARVHLNLPRTLRRNPRKNLEQSRFARPIPPDDPENLHPLHLKRNILQRVDPVRRRSLRRDEGRESRAEEDFLPRISRINTDAGGVERPESSGPRKRGSLDAGRSTRTSSCHSPPHLEIRILFSPNAMPPPIDIMRQRAGADFAKAVELGDVFNANNCVGHGKRRRSNEWQVIVAEWRFLEELEASPPEDFPPLGLLCACCRGMS